ncbi:hypothetical protein [Oceanobacter mangrovi]|uniref:hypothetical protein n=1 Tax=Oceanobacter mangrovi TaxID=2862510 RepID=UPI001C8D3BE6|nr:hypothetical protein [Oceanobacter mangrovi]
MAEASQPVFSDFLLFASTQITLKSRDIELQNLVVNPYATRPDAGALRAAELFVDASTIIEFDDAPHIPSSIINWAGEDLTRRAAIPVFSQAILRAYQPPEKRRMTEAGWLTTNEYGNDTSVSYPSQIPLGIAPDPNAAETHIIMNSVQTYTLPDETPLALADIAIDADLDSVGWKLSAQALNEATADLLRRDRSGRKELAILINGYRWEFFVAKVDESKSISNDQLNRRFNITGYSRSQYLTASYAPEQTKSITTTTAVQAATAELTGTGFTLDWAVTGLPDWTMANASFSYQSLTPMAVIKKLASAAGGIVQTDPAVDTIVVKPRYPVEPWYLQASDMDVTIHESQVTNVSVSEVPGVLYNAVFVSGESEGVSAMITRQGTSGDSPSSDITDGWITAVECNTNRGKTELGQSGDRLTHDLEVLLPETGQPGLVLPGMTAAVQHNNSAKDFRAYVSGVRISVPGRNNAKVRQTVTLDQPVGWEEYSA